MSERLQEANLPPILPPGTQVVALVPVRGPHGQEVHPRGSVGVITQSPGDVWHAYRVRFPDGSEASLLRREMSVLSHYQREGASPLVEHQLYQHVIYRCVVGSRAYGLHDDESDTDRRGVYLPPADVQWSLFGVPEQIENPGTDETYWEIQKFLTLALKANPNVLECLWTRLVEHATPLAEEMLAMREAFLSKLVYQTYNGYVMSQFKKMQGDIRNKGKVKQKHVMHLIRLLLGGITVLREGHVPVHVGEHRERLLAIKRGDVPFAEADAWRLDLHKQFEAAYQSTNLSARPDYDRVNAFLIKARRSMV